MPSGTPFCRKQILVDAPLGCCWADFLNSYTPLASKEWLLIIIIQLTKEYDLNACVVAADYLTSAVSQR